MWSKQQDGAIGLRLCRTGFHETVVVQESDERCGEILRQARAAAELTAEFELYGVDAVWLVLP